MALKFMLKSAGHARAVTIKTTFDFTFNENVYIQCVNK